MRSALVLLALSLLAAAGYFYSNEPAACRKVGADLLALVSPTPAPPASEAPHLPSPSEPSPSSSLPSATASAPVPPAVQPAPAPAKLWTPPAVLPAQPNWTWTTMEGKTYNDVVVTKVEAETVTITHSLGVAHIPIAILPSEIQKLLNYDPRAVGQISVLLDGKLISADGIAVSANPSIQYYAIYYSAQWCPPCHHFTPELVRWYNQFKPTHPNFELVFVSEDHDADSMFAYMREMSMPWPAVRFGDLKHDGGFTGSGIEKFAGHAIPDLVLVNARGKVLSDTFREGTYVGPQEVVKDTERIVAP